MSRIFLTLDKVEYIGTVDGQYDTIHMCLLTKSCQNCIHFHDCELLHQSTITDLSYKCESFEVNI